MTTISEIIDLAVKSFAREAEDIAGIAVSENLFLRLCGERTYRSRTGVRHFDGLGTCRYYIDWPLFHLDVEGIVILNADSFEKFRRNCLIAAIKP